ncbi:site-specific DNA-methyltransferase [Campylobacter upsaliensis]|uniref:Site-specific DNA-methyltransferase n=1 Tax=Campylobacter upsaliensis TaxID=28080 RepID=A0A7U8B343_CAMUP|nr:site-specific DNA-methyltransferase [Campylobacter upsaliensis]EAJ2281886.1 site-specific DNA-methyltransferase [Campylobacter upsaliensis]EAJ2283130.1 site-specific DNA-methyltransferase [Campylobacter upsaliensis]EAK1046214.1 site-specific DNA-methyltransferase [Campylobacter upsaliensis]EAK9971001.1 site-specific DNA-methyltransferase [Campylobacter upsaliensis]
MKWAFNGKFYNLRSIYSTTGIAANLLGRQFIGIEKESEFINLSIMRKNELDAKFEEFKNKLKDLQQTFF